jgi:uncharacterized protein (DUF983 family)
MARYAKRCDNCGANRPYWVETQYGQSNPFCGDCNRLLDTYKAQSETEKFFIFLIVVLSLVTLIFIAAVQLG